MNTVYQARQRRHSFIAGYVGWGSNAPMIALIVVFLYLLFPAPMLAQDDPAAAPYKIYGTPVFLSPTDTVSFHAYEDVNGNGQYDDDGSEEPNWWATAILVELFVGRGLSYSVVAHPDGTTDAIDLLPGTFVVQAGYSGIMSGCAFGSTTWAASGGSEYTIFIAMQPCPAA